jgi:hypothetical protein
MADNLRYDASNGATNTTNLMTTTSNTTQITAGHGSSAQPLSGSVFLQSIMMSSNLNTLINAVNSLVTTTTTTNLPENNTGLTLNAQANTVQQSTIVNSSKEQSTDNLPQGTMLEPLLGDSDIPPTPASLRPVNCNLTEVVIPNRPIAPSPLTMASRLTRETTITERNGSETYAESVTQTETELSTDLREKESEICVTVMHTSFERSEQGTYLSVPVSNDARALSCINEEAFDEGYDSDGQRGPFFDAVADKVEFEYYEEETPAEGMIAVVPTIANEHQNEALTLHFQKVQ